MKNLITAAVLLLIGVSAQAQQATNVNCDGCVTTKDLANQAVGRAKLKIGAVATAKLKNGAVTPAKVSAALKNDINSECPEGEVVVGKDARGRFVCELPALQGAGVPRLVLVDSLGIVLPLEILEYSRFGGFDNSYDGNQVIRGFLQVPGGIALVEVGTGPSIKSFSHRVYFPAGSECAFDVFAEPIAVEGSSNAVPGYFLKFVNEIFFVNERNVYRMSENKVDATGLDVGLINGFDCEANATPFRPERELVKVAELPYVGPFQLEMR